MTTDAKASAHLEKTAPRLRELLSERAARPHETLGSDGRSVINPGSIFNTPRQGGRP